MNDGWGISYVIALRWMSLDLTDDKSTLVQVMAWCLQATSHYLRQCWLRSMWSNGVTRPQWVNQFSSNSWHGTLIYIYICILSRKELNVSNNVLQIRLCLSKSWPVSYLPVIFWETYCQILLTRRSKGCATNTSPSKLKSLYSHALYVI